MASTLETGVLGLVLNAVAITSIADNAATSPYTNLYISLHTADPGVGGNQTTSEISYTGYARVAITRNSGTPGWTVTGTGPASASPNSAITFGAMTGGTGGTASYMGIGSASTGTGVLLASGSISPTISVTTGVTPQLTTSTAFTLQ